MPQAKGLGSIPETFIASNFWIEVDNMLEAYFTECQGLEVKTEVYEYKEGGLNTHTLKFPTRTTYTNLTLKKGFGISKKLWEWYKKTIDGTPEPKNISIIMYSGENPSTPLRRWNIIAAYPVKWSGPILNMNGAEHTIETIELAFNTFEVAM